MEYPCLTGKDNHLFKGVVYGTFTWEMLYTLGQRLGVVRSKTHNTRTHMTTTTLFDNLLYGLASSATMVFLAEPSVFTQSEKRIGTSVDDPTYKLNQVPKDSSASTYENEMNIYH